MRQLGAKISYLALSPGTSVYDRNGDRVGVIEQVLADEDEDIFHGVIVRASPPPYSRRRFAHRNQISDLHEHGVVLSVRGAELPEPGADAPARTAADHPPDGWLESSLRRAWQWVRNPR